MLPKTWCEICYHFFIVRKCVCGGGGIKYHYMQKLSSAKNVLVTVARPAGKFDSILAQVNTYKKSILFRMNSDATIISSINNVTYCESIV